MDAPQTRYKVVERGRRLEVIDTWNNNATVKPMRETRPTAPSRSAPSPVEAVRAPRLDQRGHRILGTKAWYDTKGPRQLVVTAEGEVRLNGVRIVAAVALVLAAIFAYLFWPLLFFAPFILLNEATRKNFRGAATRFLDTLNQPGTSAG